MDYLKVYPGEQKGTEDTYREQVKERIKVEEELGTGELPYGTALKVYTVGPHRVECKGMMLLELTFSPTRYGLGKLPVSSSCDLRLFFFFYNHDFLLYLFTYLSPQTYSPVCLFCLVSGPVFYPQ